MRKITLLPQHKKLFDRIPRKNLHDFMDKLMQFLNGQDIIEFDDPLLEVIFTALTMDVKTEDRRKYTSAENGKKHKGKLIKKIASDVGNSPKTEDFDFSLNYKIKNKEVNINKGNNTQEDISTEDNIPYIKSPKKERNINISSQKRVLLSASDEKKPSKEEIDFSKLMLYFNEKMKGQTIRPITTMTDVRKRAVLARLRKHGKDSIQNVIDKAAASDWLNGNNNRNWVADFNWIFQENRFVDILEGKYDNSVKKTSAKSGYVDPMIADGTRLRQDQMDYTKNIW